MKWLGSPWKQGLTDVSGARTVAAPVPRTGQCRHERRKTARDGSQGPRKKRADLQLAKEHGQQQARTCEDWLRKEDREPTDGERHTHAMICLRWENKVKFLTAEAIRGVNSTTFDAQGAGITMSWAKGTM